MILDTGICTVFRRTATQEPGGKPAYSWAPIAQSWYRELSFSTVQSDPTEHRDETRIDNRIRIHQARNVVNQDVVVLQQCSEIPEAAVIYRVVRAFHGTDDDNSQPISDLSLEVSGV
jgi:hypothetical protein